MYLLLYFFYYLKVTTDKFETTFHSDKRTVASYGVNMLLYHFSYYTCLTTHATVHRKLVANKKLVFLKCENKSHTLIVFDLEENSIQINFTCDGRVVV